MKRPKITILDLGYGNFKSLINAFDYLKINTEVTNNKKKISVSDILFCQALELIKLELIL